MGNKNRKQVHAYDPDEMARLRRVSLPPKLKCNMCEKNYNAANFSQKQLTDVRYQISTMNKIIKNPKCFNCSGRQLVELECYMCHKTKGLEGFAKSQRNNTEEARCYACTDIQLAREPVDEATYEDPNRAFVRTESSDGNYPDYFASSTSISDTVSSVGDYEDIKSNLGSRHTREHGGIDLSDHFQQVVSVSGQVSDTLIDSEFSHSTNGARPGTWSQVASTGSWHTPTVASSSACSGFDSNRYGRPGASSITGSAHSFNSSIAERSQTGSERNEMRNGFAKIKAYKPPPQVDLWVGDDKKDSSSSSDNDDDDDDNDDDDTVI
ncbi:hypothetical protein SVAN01_00242 [Stagonosporopsis vannaccii]|nr:hypothetical protein SVAN01_00242 [Stagonosporopsis vannaccii]